MSKYQSLGQGKTEYRYPARPGLGTKGRKIQLEANVFTISKLPTGDIYHYDAAITPEIPPKLNRDIFTAMYKKYKGSEVFNKAVLAFDGRKNIYSNTKLPKDVTEVKVEFEGGKVKEFVVKLSLASVINVATLNEFLNGKLNYTPQEVIQALDVIIRHDPAQRQICVGPSLFTDVGPKRIPGCVDIWGGFFMSARAGNGHMILNVDTSYTGFHADMTLFEFAETQLRGRIDDFSRKGFSPDDIRILERGLRTLRVEVTHQKFSRKYRVVGLSRMSASETVFEDQDGKSQSVAQYFKEKYGITLRYPSLPCVLAGSTQRPVSLPMELCKIVKGQKYIKKLNDTQTSDMIKIACTPPAQRAARIKEGARNLLTGVNQETINQFGIKIDTNALTTVNARILDPPSVNYFKDQVRASNGSWNMQNKRFEAPCVIKSFAVLNIGRAAFPDNVNKFLDLFYDSCNSYGIQVVPQNPPVVDIRPSASLENDIVNAYRKAEQVCGSPAQILICFLPPQNNARLYGEVKRVTDTVLGIPSQCLLGKTLQRANLQLMANVLLKINAKLSGTNSSTALPFISSRPTIIFGADVTHPSPGMGGSKEAKPSIAAVVASMDIKLARYASDVRLQNSREEIIVDLKTIVKNLLKAFYESTKCKPERIIFYRDGVSDGQFAYVQDIEIKAIRNACKELEPNYAPKITFVIVKKRHHIRFFPKSGQDGDRKGNILPGTVVDSGICHPRDFDFYLCSHAGIQGTSRPSHYYCVLDENNFGPDDLQELTYRMCFTFVRCTRSVSIVPPAYYAHLVAFRARSRSNYDDMSDTASVSSAGGGSSLNFKDPVQSLTKTMYFV